jgi:hypothetical protein
LRRAGKVGCRGAVAAVTMRQWKKTTANWWDTRDLVIAQWRDERLAIVKAMPGTPTLAMVEAHPNFPANIGFTLLEWRRRGNPKWLIAHLRKRRMSEEDQEDLAQALEGKFDRRSGRPRDIDLREAAHCAKTFLKRWRTLNKAKGISNWGHREEMMEEAVRFAIEEQKLAVKAESVLEFLRRPNARRNT